MTPLITLCFSDFQVLRQTLGNNRFFKRQRLLLPLNWKYALVILLLLPCLVFAQTAAQSLPSIPLHFGMHNIKAEVARSLNERATGLMHRSSMATHEGMLFIFEESDIQCFWMKNTLIPLSVAFLSDGGEIVNIDDMKPHSLESHCSIQPVRYVLEMNQGWFDKRGIKAGNRIEGEIFRNNSHKKNQTTSKPLK